MPFYSCILLLLYFTSTLSDCPAAYNPRDIFTGTPTPTQDFFSHQLYLTLTSISTKLSETIITRWRHHFLESHKWPYVPFMLSLATSIIEGPLRIDQYYRITVNPSTNQLLFSVNISYGTNNWQFIRIDFMADTRTDMVLGTYQAGI